MAEFHSGGRPLLSVSSEAASNFAFQGAPPRAERSHHSLANDVFDALVSHNAAPDAAAAPPPAPSPRRSDEKPPPAEATAANSPSNAPPGNDAARGADTTAPPANPNANANGPGDGGANQSQADKTAAAKDDPSKTADRQTSGDTPADPTILTQQATVTTPVAVAVAVSVNTASTNVPAATSGGSTPLAIAAAAIAATSQTLSGQVTTTPQGKTDSGSGPAAATSGSTAANTPLSAPGIRVAASVASSTADASPVISQARQLVTSPGSAATSNSAVAAAAAGAQKTTSDKVSSSAASDNPDDADPTATNALVVAQNGQQQPPATGKPDAANAAATLATSEATASSSSPLSAHEHAQAANTAHPLSEAADPSAQAFALQPQPNSATAPTTGGALSVTTAANGPVPLNGLALEIGASIKSGKSRFEIRLDPADLGRIDVRIDIDRNGQVTSHLTVEKPETLSILRQDAPQLQRALDDAGVKTGSGGLQFSLRDQSSSGQNNGGDSRPNAQRLIITDEDAIPATVAGRSYGRSLGGSGGVDIRV